MSHKSAFIVLSLLLGLFLPLTSSAQDILYRKDGTKQKIKITDIDTNGVFYKKWNNPKGSTYVSHWQNINKVVLSNGKTLSGNFGDRKDVNNAIIAYNQPQTSSTTTSSYSSSSSSSSSSSYTSSYNTPEYRHKQYRTYYNYAHEYFDIKNYKAAIKNYEFAVTYEKDPYAYYNMAAAYYNLSKYKKALECLDYASSYDNKSEIQSDIADLRKDCYAKLSAKREMWANVALSTAAIVATSAAAYSSGYAPTYTTPTYYNTPTYTTPSYTNYNSLTIAPPPMPDFQAVEKSIENEKQNVLSQFRSIYRQYNGHDPSPEEEEQAYLDYLRATYSSSNSSSNSSSSSSSSSSSTDYSSYTFQYNVQALKVVTVNGSSSTSTITLPVYKREYNGNIYIKYGDVYNSYIRNEHGPSGYSYCFRDSHNAVVGLGSDTWIYFNLQ